MIGQLKYIFLWRTRHGFLMILITTWGCKSKGKDPELNKSKERGHIFFGSSGLSLWFKEARTNGWMPTRLIGWASHACKIVHGLLSTLKKICSSIWHARLSSLIFSLEWAYALTRTRFFTRHITSSFRTQFLLQKLTKDYNLYLHIIIDRYLPI